ANRGVRIRRQFTQQRDRPTRKGELQPQITKAQALHRRIQTAAQRDATSACPHHVRSMAFAPQPECPAFLASPRRKSVAAPRAKNKIGSHSDTMPTTAKYVKYTFSIRRSPRMSNCAPTGVAIFFLRARCPSRASRAIDATVKATARRLPQAPRPNKLTAANPTATRSRVILLGVHSKAMTGRASRALHEPSGS